MADRTPDTAEIRNGFAYVPARTADMRWSDEEAAKFDRWLEQHDHEVRTEYEKRRTGVRVHIDNVDGVAMEDWLRDHDAQVRASVIPSVATEGMQQVIYRALYDAGVQFDSATVVPAVELAVLEYLRDRE